MSEITPETVEKVADLARLDIQADEVDAYTRDLDKILDLAGQMQAVNTKDVKPMAHPWDLDQRLREDKVTESNQRDLMQSTAPKALNGLYLVPKVIE